MYVVEILLHSEAREYLPHFARHHISEQDMNGMTRDRIREVKFKHLNITRALIFVFVWRLSLQLAFQVSWQL